MSLCYHLSKKTRLLWISQEPPGKFIVHMKSLSQSLFVCVSLQSSSSSSPSVNNNIIFSYHQINFWRDLHHLFLHDNQPANRWASSVRLLLLLPITHVLRWATIYFRFVYILLFPVHCCCRRRPDCKWVWLRVLSTSQYFITHLHLTWPGISRFHCTNPLRQSQLWRCVALSRHSAAPHSADAIPFYKPTSAVQCNNIRPFDIIQLDGN